MVTVDMTVPTATNTSRAKKCVVEAYPTLIRYNADGRESGRTRGRAPEETLQWPAEPK